MESTEGLKKGDRVRVISKSGYDWVEEMDLWVGHTAVVREVLSTVKVKLTLSSNPKVTRFSKWNFRPWDLELVEVQFPPHPPPLPPTPTDVEIQPHYADNGIEPIEYMQATFSPAEFEGFLKGNVIKYNGRYQRKNGNEDLKKALVYQTWLLEFKAKGSITIKSKA